MAICLKGSVTFAQNENNQVESGKFDKRYHFSMDKFPFIV